VGAAVTVLGIMAAPVMMKAKYDSRLSAGAIAAGGTLGILIPPSVMLIVMGPVIGVSVTKLYAASFGPGFLLAGSYIVYTLVRSFINPKLGPAVPAHERRESLWAMILEVVVGIVPLTALITTTLGTILAGMATPTEAAAVGSTGAFLLSAAYRRLTWNGLRTAMIKTLTTSSMVLFLAVTSNVFGAVFARLGTASVITNALLALPVPPFVMLILVMAIIFVLGWPFEWPAIILVFLPILYPVVEALKFNPLWFGALIAVNLQTAFLSPPVAMSAYYLKQVVPQWNLSIIYRGMMDFMVIQVIVLALCMIFPEIALWFPAFLEARQ
jgi:tripartite ATP-independent transporter DctM subunit